MLLVAALLHRSPTPALGLDADAAPSAIPTATDGPTLAGRQEELSGRFRELERSLLRLADVLASSDPRRSALLRRAFEQASELDIDSKLSSIVGMLEEGQLLKAGSAQAGVLEQMKMLLELLEAGDADRQASNTKEEVKRFLARLSKAIAKQREIEGATEAGDRTDSLSENQQRLGDEAEAIGEELGAFARRMDERGGRSASPRPADAAEPEKAPGNKDPEREGPPKKSDPSDRPQGGDAPKSAQADPAGEGSTEDSEGTPSGESGDAEGNSEGSPSASPSEPQGDDEASRASRTRNRVSAAKARMDAARKRLDDADRRGAREQQQKAIEELETARAELEEILRQVREEEVEKLLTQLETRLRGMLRTERGILAACEKLGGQSSLSDPTPAQVRERELEAARLAREQAGVATEASRALALVRDDGSAVAIPEALEQVRADCAQAAARLERADVGSITRGVVQDVVASLQEIVDALEKSRREQAENAPPEQGGGRPANPGEQPLVDKLSELKMIRTLQMRINTRTRRYAQLLTEGVEQAEEPELVEALQKLSVRQVNVERAARDIASGRTE